MLAGVGCKDYDDDIDKLNDRLDELTTGKIATLESQLGSLQTAVDNLKSADDALGKRIDELKSDAQLTGLKKYCEGMAECDESGSYVFDLDVQALDMAITALSPHSIKTVYSTKDWVISDFVVTDPMFGAKAEPGFDNRAAFQAAIDAAYESGFNTNLGKERAV